MQLHRKLQVFGTIFFYSLFITWYIFLSFFVQNASHFYHHRFCRGCNRVVGILGVYGENEGSGYF